MKTAVVTGASRGIGYSAAKALSEAGCRVIINYLHSDKKAQALADSLSNACIFKADVSDEDDVRKMFDFVRKRFGGTDILVNNAGVSHIGVFQLMSNKEINRVLDINLKGAVFCTKYALPDMIKNQSGIIINIASVWGEVGASCEVVYSASKAGIIGFTKALSKEVGMSGIRVNCISPGVIDTDMNKSLESEVLSDLKQDIPLKRIGSAKEVSSVIKFLASEDSSYLNGVTISVNGGMIM